MTGEIIKIKSEYFEIAHEIYNSFVNKNPLSILNKKVIAIGGESGSGKSVTTMCLQKVFHENNISSLIIHQDDYFFLPPKANHDHRLKNIEAVGPSEVNLNRIQKNINDFKIHSKEITKPVINYKADEVLEEIVRLDTIEILIVEGTYVLGLQDLDYKIFLNRNYKDTYLQRKERGRDIDSPFVESVLEIEHHIISKFGSLADLQIAKDYTIIKT